MATPEQGRQHLLATYGPCPTCGAPRIPRTTEHHRRWSFAILLTVLVCTADETHDQHPLDVPAPDEPRG